MNSIKVGKYEMNLLYNGNAYFELKDRWGDEIVSTLSGQNGNPMECLADTLYTMAREGELVRRLNGYDKQPIPSKEYIKITLKVKDFYPTVEAVMQAINDGLKTESDVDEEVDEGLLELQKKKAE